jgi:hypothetical protein
MTFFDLYGTKTRSRFELPVAQDQLTDKHAGGRP